MGENTRAVTSGDGSPDAIRREIERTQARVGETLLEIERRLSPRHVYARARAATERAVDRGRQVIDQVDELGRGRVAGGAVGSLAAVWLLARGLRARRARRAERAPEMTRLHSPEDPEAPGGARNGRGGWATAMALVGAAGLVLAARVANRQEEKAAAAVEAPVAAAPPAARDYTQPAENEHAVPATQL